MFKLFFEIIRNIVIEKRVGKLFISFINIFNLIVFQLSNNISLKES